MRLNLLVDNHKKIWEVLGYPVSQEDLALMLEMANPDGFVLEDLGEKLKAVIPHFLVVECWKEDQFRLGKENYPDFESLYLDLVNTSKMKLSPKEQENLKLLVMEWNGSHETDFYDTLNVSETRKNVIYNVIEEGMIDFCLYQGELDLIQTLLKIKISGE